MQRELARIQATQGDTARSIRRQSLARAASRLDLETDPVRLMGIGVAAATIEEKVGSEESSAPPRSDELALARRLLIAWTSGHAAACSPSTCGCTRVERAIARLARIDEALAIYAAAARA